MFGDIKVFKFPMFLVYDPGSYRVKGEHMREVMKLVRPGDILLRRYDQYLDGFFIPGYFSHVGLYLGEVTEADRALVPEAKREQLVTGEQVVIHALAEGVLMEDFLNFCRCDGMLVVRFPEVVQRAWKQTPAGLEGMLAAMGQGERALFDRLEAGGKVGFADEAWPEIRRTALSQLGREYDFGFDFTDYQHLSCSELVFFATKCLAPFLGVLPEEERLLWIRKQVIAPDAFVRAGLELGWKSPSVDERRLEKLRPLAPPLELPRRAA